MSRVSLARRMDRIHAHYRPTQSLEGRVDALSDLDRRVYRSWVAERERIISRHEFEPGELYEAWLDGRLRLPAMSKHLREALWPEWPDFNSDDLARTYTDMLMEGSHE